MLKSGALCVYPANTRITHGRGTRRLSSRAARPCRSPRQPGSQLARGRRTLSVPALVEAADQATSVGASFTPPFASLMRAGAGRKPSNFWNQRPVEMLTCLQSKFSNVSDLIQTRASDLGQSHKCRALRRLPAVIRAPGRPSQWPGFGGCSVCVKSPALRALSFTPHQ
jgi:hypothetical protein